VTWTSSAEFLITLISLPWVNEIAFNFHQIADHFFGFTMLVGKSRYGFNFDQIAITAASVAFPDETQRSGSGRSACGFEAKWHLTPTIHRCGWTI